MSKGQLTRIDISGQTFGRLTVLEFACHSTRGQAKWKCRCVCGNITIAQGNQLRSGHTRSCGCVHKTDPGALTHGHTRNRSLTPEYSSFHAAKKRCNNPKSENFKYYGGRGIKFLFLSFEEFYSYIGPRPEPKTQYSLERIDNNGHYEIGNVKWATTFEQRHNRTDWQ